MKELWFFTKNAFSIPTTPKKTLTCTKVKNDKQSWTKERSSTSMAGNRRTLSGFTVEHQTSYRAPLECTN